MDHPVVDDCQLHIEWATPAQVDTKLRSWWGNSGVFFLAKHELQVTESRENRHKADGLPAAIYGQTPPLVNAARKPGQWQTYDVVFIAPRFDGDKLLEPPYFTVFRHREPGARLEPRALGRGNWRLGGP